MRALLFYLYGWQHLVLSKLRSQNSSGSQAKADQLPRYQAVSLKDSFVPWSCIFFSKEKHSNSNIPNTIVKRALNWDSGIWDSGPSSVAYQCCALGQANELIWTLVFSVKGQFWHLMIQITLSQTMAFLFLLVRSAKTMCELFFQVLHPLILPLSVITEYFNEPLSCPNQIFLYFEVQCSIKY